MDDESCLMQIKTKENKKMEIKRWITLLIGILAIYNMYKLHVSYNKANTQGILYHGILLIASILLNIMIIVK
jgi:hypothetical protein